MSEQKTQKKRTERARCRACGKRCAVKKDGTARQHRAYSMSGQTVVCPGTTEPVVRR